jgi:hypothetical protein
MAGIERVERILEHHLDRRHGLHVALFDRRRLISAAERTSPELAVSSPSSTLASVDLPQPDSPTMATVSLSRASKLIVSLALTTRLAAAEDLVAADLVVFLRSSIFSTGAPGLTGSCFLSCRAAARPSRSH